MVDREMLSAISDLLDEKLDQKLDQRLQPLCDRLDRVEQDIKGMRQDIKALDKRLDGVEHRLDGLEQRVDGMEQDIKTLKRDVHYIKVVQLENDVMPRLLTIESCYLDTFQRYKEGAEQIDGMADDIKVLKLTISEHTNKLAQMSV